MDGDEGLEVAVALYKVHDIFHFDLRMCRRSMVGVRARVLAGTRTCRKHTEIQLEVSLMHMFTVITRD